MGERWSVSAQVPTVGPVPAFFTVHDTVMPCPVTADAGADSAVGTRSDVVIVSGMARRLLSSSSSWSEPVALVQTMR